MKVILLVLAILSILRPQNALAEPNLSTAKATAKNSQGQVQSQTIGRPALMNEMQLKALVTDINELNLDKDGVPEKKESRTAEMDFLEAQELYIVKVLDPHSDVNKFFSDVNVQVYRIIKTPADYYVNSSVVAPVRWIISGAGNVISNVDEMLIGSVSNLATGRFEDAGKSFGRSLFNIAFGLGGLFDTASMVASQPVDEKSVVSNMSLDRKITNSLSFGVDFLKQAEIHSFNDVLREWGFGCGFYLVFPVIGPQTARGVTATIAEMPLRVDTYVAAGTVLRIAKTVDEGLKNAEQAKIVLDELDLSSETGKEQFYNTLRLATLSTNKCIKGQDVIDHAKQQGYTVDSEF